MPFNFSKQKDEGIDFDITYQLPLDDMAWFGKIPGDLTLHGLATHYMRNFTNDGVNPADRPGGRQCRQRHAGLGVSHGGDLSHRSTGPSTSSGRGVSAGVYSNLNVVCPTGCPVFTLATPSANRNDIAGAF